MAKSDAPAKATAAKPADATPPKSVDSTPDSPVVSDCVVNGGKGMHVGNAVNGKVCSYHAMAYKADGTPR